MDSPSLLLLQYISGDSAVVKPRLIYIKHNEFFQLQTIFYKFVADDINQSYAT